ncbi:MAG: ATP-binding cassette domain-containing protein [Planctomycetes bacterium]|nr:ATP-binding cassette domain-containing protein [Planctomycetota bacterium]
MALQLVSVNHSYGGRPALEDVDLVVERGDCYGFIGHNGAGKSTAMRVALGLIRPRSGRVLVDGFDAARSPLEVRARMGGLIETPGFFDHLDGSRNLYQLARLQGLDRGQAIRESHELLDLVGLHDVERLPVRAYSQGMRQRLGIAQALIGRPDYILLDEPGNGLDPEGLADMRRLFRRLTREEGVTVLVSSHQLHEIAEVCNRIGVLKKGRMLLEADARSLLRSGGQLLLETSDHEGATRALRDLGCGLSVDGENLVIDPMGRAPDELSRALVTAGVPLLAIGPRPAALEEIYLAIEQGDPRAPSAVFEEEPGPAIAPRHGLWRSLRWEFQRLLSRPFIFILLVLPMVFAWYGIHDRHQIAQESAAEVAAGDLVTASSVTAFEGVTFGLTNALLVAAYVLCGLASQSLAAELDRGTLRNAFLRPVRRGTFVLGKFLTFMIVSLLIYGWLIAGVIAMAAWYFDFEAPYEILPNGEKFFLPELSRDLLFGALRDLVLAGMLPFTCFSALGFVAGAIARSGAAALTISLGGILAFDLGRAVSREFDLDSFMPPAHMPSKLGDTSFLRHYEDVVTGVSNQFETFSQVHLLPWFVGSLLIALVVVSRRNLR